MMNTDSTDLKAKQSKVSLDLDAPSQSRLITLFTNPFHPRSSAAHIGFQTHVIRVHLWPFSHPFHPC